MLCNFFFRASKLPAIVIEWWSAWSGRSHTTVSEIRWADDEPTLRPSSSAQPSLPDSENEFRDEVYIRPLPAKKWTTAYIVERRGEEIINSCLQLSYHWYPVV